MALRIAGTITLVFKAKISTTNKRKNAATIKKPPAVLLTADPIQKARPQKAKNRKNIPNKNAAKPIAAPDAAVDALCVTFALVRCK